MITDLDLVGDEAIAETRSIECFLVFSVAYSTSTIMVEDNKYVFQSVTTSSENSVHSIKVSFVN